MTSRLRLVLALTLSLPLAVACGDGEGDGDGGGGGMDAGPGGGDGGGGDGDGGDGTDGGGGGMDGSTTGDDGGGVIVLDGGGILLPDGNILPAGPITCQGHLYACGDTIDNDGDGLVDDRDPDCLGPCDNNEGGFDLMIPGGGSAPCKKDCYFDQDTGSGNDRCEWDHRCDPLEPSLAGEGCMYRDPPPASAQCPDEQHEDCDDICAPLVPNGCDCFGCCELPAGEDGALIDVYIGTTDADGNPTCSLDDLSGCAPCTRVLNCNNPCGECEICLGRPELPPECLPPPPGDAGPRPDAGALPDGATPPPVDAGMPPPPPMCDDGRTACGFPGSAPCPAGFFCLTGCCTFFG